MNLTYIRKQYYRQLIKENKFEFVKCDDNESAA